MVAHTLVVFGMLLLCVVCWLLYKIKHSFWAKQPVVHVYDWHYWFFPIGILRKELPKPNAYTNFYNVTTQEVSTWNPNVRKEMVVFLQHHYLRQDDKGNAYHPQSDNVWPYFHGHGHPCFLSIYYNKDVFTHRGLTLNLNLNLNQDQRQDQGLRGLRTQVHDVMAGCITSRPMTVYLRDSDIKLFVYYVDYLCVQQNYRKRGLAQQLIQTHEYMQSHTNKEIAVSVFKREEELTGIVPIVVYKSTCYCIHQLLREYCDLQQEQEQEQEHEHERKHPTLVTADQQNMYYVHNFIMDQQEARNLGNFIMITTLSNMMELSKTNNWCIYFLLHPQHNKPVAAYFFRHTCTTLSQNKQMVNLMASCYDKTSCTLAEFEDGFFRSLLRLSNEQKEEPKKLFYLLVEQLGYGNQLLAKACHPWTYMESSMAYFFYNFARTPYKPEHCFVLV